MNKKARLIIYIFLSGLFLFLDQALKYFSRLYPDFAYYVFKPWLGWEHMANRGIAFSLPFSNIALIILTPAILLGLAYFVLRKKRSGIFYFAFFLIIAGAISNFIDRIMCGATIDYLRLLTSVINLGDVMIVAGAGMLVFEEIRKRVLIT